MARVVLDKVTKTFEVNITAVNQVSLDIEDKEFLAIVGPSGCGKTTLLRMIAGLEEITEGTIRIGERIVNNIPPGDRNIAMVFQNYALYPHMTVFQNMAFALKLRKISRVDIQKRVMETAQMLDIETLLERKPKALSGGQRQRVALGRAIVRNPKVFLYDEPLSNLDAKLRVSMRAELKALHHRLQTTSIYVTHDQAEAMTLGDRICVMYKGIIQQVDEPMKVYDRPVNKFVAGFLGMPSMNFFEGRLAYKDDQPIFVLGDQVITLPDRLKKVISEHNSNKVVLGIRPENMGVKSLPNQIKNTIHATVKVIEPLGDRMSVYLDTNTGIRLIANLDPYVKMNLGQDVHLFMDLGKIHLFEPGNLGKNLVYLE